MQCSLVLVSSPVTPRSPTVCLPLGLGGDGLHPLQLLLVMQTL